MTTQSPSAADRLRELKNLHDEGVISDDEFAEMRDPLVKELGAKGEIVPNETPSPDSTGSVSEPLIVKPSAPNSPQKRREWRLEWLLIGVVALLAAVAILASNYRTIEHWAFPERLAYDSGVAFFHTRNDAVGDHALSCAYLRDARATVDPSHVEGTLDALNDVLYDTAFGKRISDGYDWESSHDEFFVGGYWDEAARTCPDAFDKPTLIGRP